MAASKSHREYCSVYGCLNSTVIKPTLSVFKLPADDERSLLVLLWKHLVVRRRRWFNTIIDLMAPVCLFYLLYSSKDSLNPNPGYVAKMFVAKVGVQRLEDVSIIGPDTILYLPDTYLVGLLMDDVGRKLQLNRLPYFHRFRSGYYPCTDDELLEYFTKIMYNKDAVLIFHNTETWPNKLNYTIRMKQDFHTEHYAPLEPQHGPQTVYGEVYGTFMKIQWAVDSSFIEMHTGRNIVPRVSVEEFPYSRASPKAINPSPVLVCSLLAPLCWLGLMLNFVFLTCRLLEERVSGAQELIKMMGVTTPTLGVSHYLNVLPVGLIYSIVPTILLKTSSTPMLPNTDGYLISVMLLLYFNTVVASSFVCSYTIANVDYASSLAMVSYGLMWLPTMIVEGLELPLIVHYMTGFIPHMPMTWFWAEVSDRESVGSGVTSSNMSESTTGPYRSVVNCYVFLALQTAMWYILAWYLSLVRPQKYGQTLPWNFIFQIFIKKKADKMETINPIPEIEYDERYFETPAHELIPGIIVDHVSKVYGKETALKDVSMKVHQGEITVLLGHNGAGKTSLMSIITGMTNATKGKVYVHGYDTATQQNQVRKYIGLCPQQDICFSNLTLQEHIMFFTMLKHESLSEARTSSRELAAILGLEDNLDMTCDALSGGMRRRAQFSFALAGNANVLVLDEPTTGLDIETRRELWDLLLSLRENHTIFITTHFMEEADAIGDRIAALHDGELRCFATPMYLKRVIGTGYRLTLTTIGIPKESAINRTVLKYVPAAEVREVTYNSISYNLPTIVSNMFPGLFTALERNKSDLNINTIGIGVSTLEDVFLKLCSNIDTAITEAEVEDVTPDPIKDKYSGVRLYWRQFIALLRRQTRYVRYYLWLFLALQVFLPLLVIYVTTSMMNNKTFELKKPQPRSMDLDMYSDLPEKRVLFNDISNNYTFRTINDEYPGVDFRSSDNIELAIHRLSTDELEYNKYIAGLEINHTDARILYSTRVRHAAPVALNMLSNLLAMQPTTGESERIYTYNHPIEPCSRSPGVRKEPKQLHLALIWTMFVVFFLQTTHLNCVTLPCTERETGTRHIHIISGCPAELYWMTTFIFHLSTTFFTLILPTVILTYLLDQDGTFKWDFIVAFTVLLTIGCMPLLALMYLVSLEFTTRTTNAVLIACLFLFGVLFPIFKAIDDMRQPNDKSKSFFVYYVLGTCKYISPPYVLMTSVFQCVYVAVVNTWCKILIDNCPVIFVDAVGWDSECAQKCCAGETPRCYFCLDDFSPYSGMLILIMQFIILMILVFLTERGAFKGVNDWLKNRNYSEKKLKDLDETVLAEQKYVEHEIIKHANNILNDSLLVHDVHKRYVKLFGKSFAAVRGVSFSVKKGECFGLLGVNGAGKSTTFKVLTDDECATRGQIFGNGYHLRRGTSKYLQTLSYCPQFFGLDMFQTGKQNLSLVLTLRGLNKKQVSENVDAWIGIVGLENYAKNKVETYSGGCVRRLGTAAALCSGSPLALLDEPSAGVDVAARRRLWTAFKKALKQHRSIVITSHSMDEMETLCFRIAIMVDGQIRVLGSPAGLRAAYAAGHAVVFKLKHDGNPAEKKREVEELKKVLSTQINCTLKDEHMTMLHYHVNETMAYSELFKILEKIKSRFPNLIEDYSATETTLEEVFLSFAKTRKENA